MSKRRAKHNAEEERSVKRIKLQKNPFDVLPDELLCHILTFSPETNVCSKWRRVTRSGQFWRSVCVARWGEFLPLDQMKHKEWMRTKAQYYLIPSPENKPDWELYYSLRSFFGSIVQQINEWKEKDRDILLESTELSNANFQQFFNHIQHFDKFNVPKFLLKLLPVFISNKKLGMLSYVASYFSDLQHFSLADPALIKYFWKISQEIDVYELQFKFFHATCKQFSLLREYDEEMRQIFKLLVRQMIQYGAEEEPQIGHASGFEWIYPSVATVQLISDESIQAEEMLELLADIVIEAFHETTDELRQTSAIGALNVVDRNDMDLPARLIHLALEGARSNSTEVQYASVVLFVKLLDTEQELDLTQNDVCFIFRFLDSFAQPVHLERGLYLIKPIYNLISRFPRDFISDEEISLFIEQSAHLFSRGARVSFRSMLTQVKYFPKIAAVWKGRITSSWVELKEALSSFKIDKEKFCSFYLRAGYNALGEKFHDEVIDFIERAKKDKKINLSYLYAHCGDILYDIFKQKNNHEEAEAVITTLMDLFSLEKVSFADVANPDSAKIAKRYAKLKKKCRNMDQYITAFVDGLLPEEPILFLTKLELDLFRSKFNTKRKSPKCIECGAALLTLLKVAERADLGSERDAAHFRTKTLACCIGYLQHSAPYKHRILENMANLYEALLPCLSFTKRTFYASETLGLVRFKNDVPLGFSYLTNIVARSILYNPTTRNSMFADLIDCVIRLQDDGLRITFPDLIASILFSRSDAAVAETVNNPVLHLHLKDCLQQGTDSEDSAAQICAMLGCTMNANDFNDLLNRCLTTIDDIKTQCKVLLETSKSPRLSDYFVRKFVAMHSP